MALFLLRSGTQDGTLFGSDDDTTHLVVFFSHEHFDMRCTSTKMGQPFFGRKQTRPVCHGPAQGFQED